jgi:ubiquinone/menaquinone biosynthesis C-methylase UbiE
MKRIPEPELMTEDDQARAYASADFEEAHNRMIEVFGEFFPSLSDAGHAVDLGCGPGDIACRFAARYPDWWVDAVDASPAMLGYGPVIMERYPGVATRVTFVEGLLPHCPVPRDRYDAVLSNSLLHHLADPQVLWTTIRRLAGSGAPVLIMDLMRPAADGVVDDLVAQYAAGEPDVLRRDFANSLRAAYRVDEVESQLAEARLPWLTAGTMTDRHMIVSGIAP